MSTPVSRRRDRVAQLSVAETLPVEVDTDLAGHLPVFNVPKSVRRTESTANAPQVEAVHEKTQSAEEHPIREGPTLETQIRYVEATKLSSRASVVASHDLCKYFGLVGTLEKRIMSSAITT
ncbi:hypothetical protein G7Y89_g4678 [Cudoniella acicularis]|uniref:Uncharacterized protein n=1 Tax=Cudoniella acicularis TaxID=354080 RepID=A0A8H4RR09_9HELO|nr:hypothetical protein G7Y89_g4678 [Cudoniella acicularis]